MLRRTCGTIIGDNHIKEVTWYVDAALIDSDAIKFIIDSPCRFILVSHTYIPTIDRARIIYHKTLPQEQRIAFATGLGADRERAISLDKHRTDLRQLKITLAFTDK